MTGPENNAELVARLITATITNTRFLQGLKALWSPELVGSGWRWIAGESFKWLEEKGEAPGRNIELAWAARPMDEETQKDLEGLLERLNAEYEAGTQQLDTEALLQAAEEYLEQKYFIKHSLQLWEAAEAKDQERAREILRNFNPPQLVKLSPINPARQPEAIREAFHARSSPLVQLGGALQELLGERIVRDSLVVLLAEEKAGKSYLLQAVEFGAVKAGSNVIAFQCGDLSRWQKIARMSKTLTRRSLVEKDCRELLVPVPDCLRSQRGKCDQHPQEPIVTEQKEGEPYPRLLPYGEAAWYEPCLEMGCFKRRPTTWYRTEEACAELTEEAAVEAWERFNTAHPDKFLLETFQSETATIAQMETVLTQLWEHQGWRPQVVVVDYPDICAPEPGTASKDVRHQENAKWLALRRMSQKWECAVVAPTQAKENKNKEDRRLLRPNMFSEDKRKKAHPTDALGLNIDKWDKRRGIWRLNYLFGREDAFDVEQDQVAVMHCLERGLPNIGSFWIYRRTR